MRRVKVVFALEGHRDYQVIPILAQRVITQRHPEVLLAFPQRLGRKKGHGFISELHTIIRQADARGDELCVAVVDANDHMTDRRRQLREAVEKAGPVSLSVVTGIANHALEAWLLADEQAVSQALSNSPAIGRCKDPRSLRNPKDTLEEIIRAATDHAEYYTDAIGAAIAHTADLSVLRDRCPDFDAFAGELLNSRLLRTID